MKNEDENEKVTQKTVINWYPGHMAKTKRLISEKLELIDIVVEVVDARIPLSSHIKDIDSLIKNKKRIIVFSKIDLCDIEETKKWKTYYEKLGYKVVMLDLSTTTNLGELYKIIDELMEEKVKKDKLKGLKPRRTRLIILGSPNVGKSSLINRIVNKKITNVGNKPGVTKNLEWIRISEKHELLDSPGILWPNQTDESTGLNLAAFTIIKEEIIPVIDVALYILKMLESYYPNILKEKYKIDNISDDIEGTFVFIGKNKGLLSKGGTVDIERVAFAILNDIKSEHIKKITFDRL